MADSHCERVSRADPAAGADDVARKVLALRYEHPEYCAWATLSDRQKWTAVCLAACLIGLAVAVRGEIFLALNIFCTIFYVAFTLYKLDLVIRGVSRGQAIDFLPEEPAAPGGLPVYTILVPLYRETEILGSLKEALGRLDYPRDRLDVQLLLEEDDTETVEAARAVFQAPEYRIVLIPPGPPRTKPKACNYGLLNARGEYLVIYDAEDRPEPDQLRKACAAFRSLRDDRVICLQARVNIYNQNQNILTKWFTCEYSCWFDLYLPGLSVSGIPVPLGGTSNHFRTAALREIGGWDAYNVAEDCDLGMRLHRMGYRTRMIDSTTWEEACMTTGNWMRQRSRWIKGYVQTYLVHTRRPWRLLGDMGPRDWFGFHMTIGGMFFCFLVNPVFWVLSAVWLVFRQEAISSYFPGIVFALSAGCLFLGGFAFVFLTAVGVLKRRYFHLVKYALFSPAYWVLMSVGAWKGVWQLVRRPHHWEKTEHGFSLRRTREAGDAS